jgi:RHS repeat-associated protein
MNVTGVVRGRLVRVVTAAAVVVAGVGVAGAPGAGAVVRAAGGQPPGPGSSAAAALRVRHHLGRGPRAAMVPGHHVGRVPRVVAVRRGQLGRRAPAPVWPSAQAVVAAVPAAAAVPGRDGRAAAGRARVVWARVGGSPVSVAAAGGAGSARPGGGASSAGRAAGVVPVSRVRVGVAGHGAAVAAGADGLVFSVVRADGGRSGGRVRVRVSYAGFASAYGAGFGSRLALFAMPGCALVTPRVRGCRGMRPVASVNDWKARTVSAVVTAAPAGADAGAGGRAGVVFAVASSTSGGTGDFKATSLAPSSSWQVGLQTGDFTWSYPFRVPPPMGGAAPSLSLGYDSGAADGETAQANSQPGLVGEGFALGAGGFIQRQYASCGDLITGKITGSHNDTDQTFATGDQCWAGNNAFLSLGGRSEEIILDQSTGVWHLANDDGSTVKLLTGCSNGNNGDYNNTCWELITPDGTQYYFGLNELPGWTSANLLTNSVWTEPVVGLGSGDPCHTSSYATSYCATMPYRWELALVVDPNGNAASYFYSPQTSYYAYDSYVDSAGTAHYGKALPYTSGGTLSDIYYGMQDNSASSRDSGGNVYAKKAFNVHFGYVGRCSLYGNDDTAAYTDTSTKSTCDSTHTAADWPDTPWDLSCAAAAGCTGSGHDAPAFFGTQMLATVTTAVEQGFNTPEPVDTWTLGYDWLNADVNNDLVLASVTHQGDVGGSVALPPVTFGWTAMNNRVPYNNNYPAMQRYRLTSVISETGAQTDISYNPASCAATQQSDPSGNDWPCFPQFWTGGDFGGTPGLSWFYKYTVASVVVHDATGGEPAMPAYYTYCNDAACDTSGRGVGWHYDTNSGLVPAKDRSWSSYRGYEYVHVVTGDPSGTQSETDYTFMRGMSGDPVPAASGSGFTYPTVTITPQDTAGTTQTVPVTDANAWNGFALETVTYDGLNTAPMIADQVNYPWKSPSPTAQTGTQAWGQPLTAYLTGTAETDTYTTLASGSTRHTQTINTFNNGTGLLAQTSQVNATQDQCTAYTYPATPSAAGLLNYPVEVKVTAAACGTASPPLVSDTKTSYDGQAWGTAPVSGNVTETDTYSTGDPAGAHWVAQYRGTYDSYGRAVSAENAAGATTTTAYSSSFGTGYATTQATVTSPLTASTTAATTTHLDPEWGSPADSTDAAGERTDYGYDPLGRVTSVWLPGQTGATRSADGAPNYAYAYSISATAAPSVATTRLVAAGKIPVTSYQIFDSLLRPRQAQAPAEGPAGGMQVADTFYDSRGNAVITNGPYTANATASGTLWDTTEPAVPNETLSAYDGAGRVTTGQLYSYGSLLKQTSWAYPGADEVTVTPPAGGTVTTTHTNALGQTTQIDQYHSATGPTGPYDATAYTYTRARQLAGITDAAGNQWASTYDLLGHQTSVTTPDAGTTTSSYNDLGQLTSVTDAAGKTVSYTYDAAGRKTAAYNTTGGATQTGADQLTAWAYDTAKLPGGGPATGQPASSTSYVGGTSGEAYTQTINTYDQAYNPTSTTYTIPAAAVTGALGGTSYTFGAAYNVDGTPASTSYPAAGGLPAETVNYVYDNLGSPFSAWSAQSDYAEQTIYTPGGQPAETDLGTSTSGLWSRTLDSYDPATAQLTQSRIQRETTNWANDSNLAYTYNPAGNLTSATDSVTGSNQCYTYDYLARLSAAWTQPSAACSASPPGASGLGGPTPYQQTLSYDNGGTANGSTNGTTSDITGSTLITGTGTGATTTQVSYTYPAYGAAQPHAPTGYTTTTNGNTTTTTQAWTAPGQLASTTTSGTTTSYNWNGTGMPPGQLASVTTTTAATTSYRYDASGNLLIVKDGATATLYLPGEELSATGSTVTATRYYSLGGQVIAARTSPTSLIWLFSDPHGTATTAIDTTTQNITHRYYTPFGQLLTTTPTTTTWPGTRRFVGGTYDSTTGLTNLGARQYNPATTAFISPDPLLSPYTPSDLNPYDYAYNNPTTNTDPTGLLTCDQYGNCTISTTSVNTVHVNGSSPSNQSPVPVVTGSLPVSYILAGVPHAGQIERAYQAAAADLTARDGGPVPTYLDWQALGDVCEQAPGLCPSWLPRYAAMQGGIDQHQYQLAEAALAQRAQKYEPSPASVILNAYLLLGGDELGDADILGVIAGRAAGNAAKDSADLVDAIAVCGGMSFTPATKVLLASGVAVPIASLKPGDKVLATNTRTGKTQAEPVTAVLVHHDTNRYDLKVRTASRTAVIGTTATHLFWDLGTRRWVKAAALGQGEHLETPDGTATVLGGYVPRNRAGWMWDLTVTGDHDFYIVTPIGSVLVHNCAAGPGLRGVNWRRVFINGTKNAAVGGTISFVGTQLCPRIRNAAVAYGCLIGSAFAAAYGGAWVFKQSLELRLTYALGATEVTGLVGGILWGTTGKP